MCAGYNFPCVILHPSIASCACDLLASDACTLFARPAKISKASSPAVFCCYITAPCRPWLPRHSSLRSLPLAIWWADSVWFVYSNIHSLQILCLREQVIVLKCDWSHLDNLFLRLNALMIVFASYRNVKYVTEHIFLWNLIRIVPRLQAFLQMELFTILTF